MNICRRIREKLIYRGQHVRFGQRGITLVEAAVAILLLGGGVLTMILTMSGGVMAVQVNGEEVTAQSLARSQMEYIKEYPYNPLAKTYPIVTAPADYDIEVTVSAVPGANADIQKVTAVITRAGQTVFTIEDYKVNR
jgi:Tfp pilus assembly protein PilV